MIGIKSAFLVLNAFAFVTVKGAAIVYDCSSGVCIPTDRPAPSYAPAGATSVYIMPQHIDMRKLPQQIEPLRKTQVYECTPEKCIPSDKPVPEGLPKGLPWVSYMSTLDHLIKTPEAQTDYHFEEQEFEHEPEEYPYEQYSNVDYPTAE
ncbi:uncharacterized protein LOC142223195 [Haematobia irritans]|uniref:uncharacterized protein LOC142223195 n=1 Tax=Haematobia irritans TaxID=7368 RepID=UPI003F506AD2